MRPRTISRVLLIVFTGCPLLPLLEPGIGADALFPDPAFLLGSAPFDILKGDFNRDNIGDLAVANRTSNDVSVLIGDGRGGFLPQIRYPAGQLPTRMAQGDLNDDGIVDLAAVNASSDDVSVFLGRGDGSFSAASNFPAGDMPGSLVLEDFTGDGRTDLVVGNEASRDLSILVGRGDGGFDPQVRYPLASGLVPKSLVAGYFNADTRADLAVASGPEITILLAGGSAFFVPGARLTDPGVLSPHQFTVVAGGDLNGDGDTDLVALDDRNGLRTFLGSGDGWFALAGGASPPTFGDVVTLLLEDFNHDGHLDVIRPHKFLPGLPVLLGRGDGRFNEGPVAETWSSATAVATDLNRDGHLDLISAPLPLNLYTRSSALVAHLGRGDGTFDTVRPPIHPTGDEPVITVVGDFTGDGVLDLANAYRGPNSGAQPAGYSIFEGSGDGRFGPAANYGFPLPGYRPDMMVGSDLDKDGWGDLVVSSFGSEVIQVLMNRGGLFQVGLYLAGQRPVGLATGDVNGDGHQDIVTANRASSDMSFLMGHGDGTFEPQLRVPLACEPSNVQAKDLNGDHVDDVAVTLTGGCNDILILLGVRGGTPVSVETFRPPHLIEWIVLADFDADGSPDLLTGRYNLVSTYHGNGDGTFRHSTSLDLLAEVSGQLSIVASDFDQDGVLDLAFALGYARFDIWLGGGDGAFAYHDSFSMHGRIASLVAADFNVDQWPDVAVTVSSHDVVAVRLNRGIPSDPDSDGIPDLSDNCPTIFNPAQADTDADGRGDACDSCPLDPLDDADDDGHCADADNCPSVANPGQEDADADSLGDACDNCPLIPNVDQDPCACAICAPVDILIDFDSPLGRGSGLVTWQTGVEYDLQGFNVVVFDSRGARVQQNPVLIPCVECITGQGAAYAVVVPKHKSGRSVFVEQVRRDGRVELYGPAQRR
jgi:hypothetical protein